MVSDPEAPFVPGTIGETPALAVNRTTIRLVIVHSNRLFREAIAFALSRQAGSVVVANVGGAGELADQLDLLRADVYVIDLGASSGRGLDDARKVRRRSPAAKILLTGLGGTEAEILACAEAGAGGYLTAQASLDELVENVRAVASGESICSRRVACLLFSRVAQAARDREGFRAVDGPRVTRREREIIALINAGLSNKEIAARLRIEVQTVKNHIHNILEKLHVDGRRDLRHCVNEQGQRMTA
jgi:DNA-binding NarL/FixJ family response regulator